MKNNVILKAKDLSKTFSNESVQQHVLKNLNLEVYKGDFTVVMGNSGSGKSTLLYALSGMDRPTLGTISYYVEDDTKGTPVISIMVPILALGFLIHILYGCWLTIINIKARGGYKRYEVASKAKVDSWSSKNMLVLGLVIIGCICLHLTDFWAHMQLPEMFGLGVYENNPYLLLSFTFGRWWLLLLYLAWFVVLFLHLTHGFWSMFQTIGWDGKVWFKRLKVIGIIVAAIICLMFAATAINAFIQAPNLL